ncbi:hypothetical protein JOD60_000921 [Microbacterium aurum]|nr:hypothetical protein [Microbacterium aurum]
MFRKQAGLTEYDRRDPGWAVSACFRDGEARHPTPVPSRSRAAARAFAAARAPAAARAFAAARAPAAARALPPPVFRKQARSTETGRREPA